jgi:hypothetical protein
MDELGAPIPDLLPFGPSLYALVGQVSTFGLSPLTTFISGSHMLTILRNPSSQPPWCWQSQRLPRGGRCHPWRSTGCIELVGMKDTLVPRASHPAVTSDARPGRIPVAEDRVASCRIPVSSDDTAVTTATCTTSCRTLTESITCRATPCDTDFATRPMTHTEAPMLRGPIGPVGFMRWLGAFPNKAPGFHHPRFPKSRSSFSASSCHPRTICNCSASCTGSFKEIFASSCRWA